MHVKYYIPSDVERKERDANNKEPTSGKEVTSYGEDVKGKQAKAKAK